MFLFKYISQYKEEIKILKNKYGKKAQSSSDFFRIPVKKCTSIHLKIKSILKYQEEMGKLK